MNVPLKYLPKRLTKRDKATSTTAKKSRAAYKKGKYQHRKPVKSFTSKRSQHIINAERIYKIKTLAVNDELSKKTDVAKKH